MVKNFLPKSDELSSGHLRNTKLWSDRPKERVWFIAEPLSPMALKCVLHGHIFAHMETDQPLILLTPAVCPILQTRARQPKAAWLRDHEAGQTG